MAKGYFMITEDIKDEDGMNAYSGKAIPTIFQSGGKPIIVARNAEVLEGKWHGTQTVVLEFDSVDAARAWYNSDAYQAVIGKRHAAADSNAVIVTSGVRPARPDGRRDGCLPTSV